jgi:hypothetical protein
MSEPVKFIFFCIEADYPKFLAILPDYLPATYQEFVARVNQSIENRMKEVTIVETDVGFDEFMAFCDKSGKVPNYDTLVAYTFQVWGRGQ